MRLNLGAAAALAFFILTSAIWPASAQGDISFKSIRILIGSSPGGGFDATGRVVARHLGNHLPGKPQVIVSNLAGAGSTRAVQSLKSEVKDGSYIVLFNPGLISYTMLNPTEAENFKFTDFAFIGSATADVRGCWAWHTTGVKSVADLVKKDQFITGHTGTGALNYAEAALLKNLLGAKLKQIIGYAGETEVRLGVERGELDGYCGTVESVPEDWLKERKAHMFVRISKATVDALPKDVPPVSDLVKNVDDKKALELIFSGHEASRPFMVSGEVSKERVKVLRDAFWATIKDPAFLADARKMGRDMVDPMRGEDVQKLIATLYSYPKEILDRAANATK